MFNNMKKLKVTSNKNKLFIDDGIAIKDISLPTDIKQIEQIGKIIIVRIYPKSSNFINENIFAISYDGELIWQVEKIDHVSVDSPYTGISIESGLLSAYNWDGFDYLIDPKNGKIISRKFVK